MLKSFYMAYVADLHTHSRYARACSRELNIPNLAAWAEFKGVDLVGTGDALHPLWQQELKKDLKDAGGGVYQYGETKFLLTVEVACIYSEAGKQYRIHTLIFLPSLDSVFKLSEVLTKKGANLASDGRPIMGLSTRALCQIVFQVEPEAVIIPAHIWTPWFSLYGANSGYDCLDDCFGEFAGQILAAETGLSSQPAMNWRIKELDSRAIVSFSDLHSLPRLARECTIFKGRPGFASLRQDLEVQNLVGTIEFFPEEGKYHYSGHRSCGVVYSPRELTEKGRTCPVCKKPLTVGVTQRVEELASREERELRIKNKGGVYVSETFPQRPGFRMLVQLEEILAEALNTTVASQKVKIEYKRLVTTLDPELKLLTKTPLELIAMAAGERVAEGVKKVREGDIHIEPGFDNTYGVVKIWGGEEGAGGQEQVSMF